MCDEDDVAVTIASKLLLSRAVPKMTVLSKLLMQKRMIGVWTFTATGTVYCQDTRLDYGLLSS